MSGLIEAIILGVVQGLTEFLPISSSGHLLLGQYFLGLDQETFGLSFDAAVHLGTVVAVVSFFRRDLRAMALAFFRSFPRPDLSDDDQRLAYLVLAATVPAAILGFVLEDLLRTSLRSPWVVVLNLAAVGVLFVVGEAVGKKSRRVSTMNFREALGVGFAQAAALVPGVSRSGATITLGLFLGLRREEAARFSFLLSVPIVVGAGALSLVKAASESMGGPEVLFFLAGFASSAIVGYLAIKFLLNYLSGHSLNLFAYYRFALAALVAALLLLGA